MNLGLFDVQVLLHGCLAYDGCDRENSLSSYSAKDNICFHSLQFDDFLLLFYLFTLLLFLGFLLLQVTLQSLHTLTTRNNHADTVIVDFVVDDLLDFVHVLGQGNNDF